MRIKTGYVSAPIEIGKDYVFGSQHSISTNFGADPILMPDGDWRSLAPKGELQHHKEFSFDSYGCVSHGMLNVLELLQRRVHGTNVNYSDRFVVKGSGTKKGEGNNPRAVGEFIRNNWSVFEEEWPREGVDNLDDYFADIPKELFSLAKVRKAKHLFGYEFVNPSKANLKEALKYSPIGMAVGLNGVDSDGLWYRSQASDAHWLTLLHIDEKGIYTVLDSYEPFIKRIRGDFQSSYTQRYFLDAKQLSLMLDIIARLKELIFRLQYGRTV